MSVEMEKRARMIFRDALLKHYIDELPCGDKVEMWLITHGGWFPDNLVIYDDGTPLTQPKDEGIDAMSKEPERAFQEARNLMELMWPVLDDYDADLMSSMSDWLTSPELQQAPPPSQLTEANVEANDFRLEFAKETLQSFKRGRISHSRSPRRQAGLEPVIDTIRNLFNQQIADREKMAEMELALKRKDGEMELALKQKDIEMKFLERSLAIERTCVDKFKGLLSHR